MELKRYLLFIGPDYYPSGGWQDFSTSFDTIAEAREVAPTPDSWQWWHIVDSTTWELLSNDAVDESQPEKPAGLSAALVARAFSVMLPKHGWASVHHNPHISGGMSVEQHLDEYDEDFDWVSPVEHQKARTTGELWFLCYGAREGDSCRFIAAASLDAIAQWLEDNGMAFGN